MFNVYELYDLHLILVAIRCYPNDPINKNIVLSILDVLENRTESDEPNQLRKAIQTIKFVNAKDIYDFAFTENRYSYFPLPFLKDERIYGILISSFNELLSALNEENSNRIVDLADCLHTLPILLVENDYSVPKIFWKTIITHYRDKWNNDFLKIEQKTQMLKSTKR